MKRHYVAAVMIGLSAILAVQAETVTMLQNNMKDFDAAGNFVGFGTGKYYAKNWEQYAGHGYFTKPDKLSSEYDYVIPKDKSFRTPQASEDIGPFPGKSMTVESGGQLIIYNQGLAVLDFGMEPGLLYKSNKTINNYIGGAADRPRSESQSTIAGKVTINPKGTVHFDPGNNLNVGFTFRDKLVVGADTTINIKGSYTYTDNRAKFFLVELPCDTSEVLGTFNVNSNAILSVGANGLVNSKSVKVYGCTLPDQADHGGTIRACAWSDCAVIPSLTLESNTSIEVPVDSESGSNGVIRVTQSLTHGKPIRVYLSNGTHDNALTRHPVLTLANGATGDFELDDFVFGGFLDGHLQLNEPVLSVGENEDGEKTLFVEASSTVHTILDSDGGNTAATLYFCQNTNAEAWSDHQLPHGDIDYVSDVRYLRFPLDTETDYIFPGRSLTIERNFYETYKTFTCSNLVMKSGSAYYMWNGFARTIYGNILACPDDPEGATDFIIYQNRKQTFAASFSGQGKVYLRANEASGSPCGTAILKGDNSGFRGKFDVLCKENAKNVYPSEKAFMTLDVSAGNQLGGDLDAFTYDALALRNYTFFDIHGDVTLAKSSNRGVLVDMFAKVDTHTGYTLAVETGLTLNGELRKQGAGILALGGTARFGANGDADPQTGSNLVTVVAGALKPLSAECLNGAALSFAAGTRLAFDVTPDDETLAGKGLVLTREGSALTCEDALAVTFVAPEGGLTSPTTTVTLLTGSEALCSSVAEKLDFKGALKGYAATLLPLVDNGDGTFTLKAELTAKGLTILLR